MSPKIIFKNQNHYHHYYMFFFTFYHYCCHHRQAHHRNRRHRTSSLSSSFSPWIAWLSFLHDLARFGVTLNCRFPTKQIWPLKLIHSTSTSDHRSISHHQNCEPAWGQGTSSYVFFGEIRRLVSKYQTSKNWFHVSFKIKFVYVQLVHVTADGFKIPTMWNVCKCWWKG